MSRQRFVSAHACIVIDVARFGQADNRMQQERAIDLSRRSFHNLFVCTVQWVASLKCHYVLVTELFETLASFSWAKTQLTEIVVPRQLNHTQLSREVESARAMHLGYKRMTQVGCAQDTLSDLLQIALIDFFNRHHCQQLVPRISKSYFLVEVDV